MTKFFVGQRVRLVKFQQPTPGIMPVQVGDEGRIDSIRYFPKGHPTDSGGKLAFDSNCSVVFNGGGLRSSHTDFLEPIIPSGHCPSEYSFTELMDRCRQGEVENA